MASKSMFRKSGEPKRYIKRNGPMPASEADRCERAIERAERQHAAKQNAKALEDFFSARAYWNGI